jgi:hypothetical protein
MTTRGCVYGLGAFAIHSLRFFLHFGRRCYFPCGNSSRGVGAPHIRVLCECVGFHKSIVRGICCTRFTVAQQFTGDVLALVWRSGVPLRSALSIPTAGCHILARSLRKGGIPLKVPHRIHCSCLWVAQRFTAAKAGFVSASALAAEGPSPAPRLLPAMPTVPQNQTSL